MKQTRSLSELAVCPNIPDFTLLHINPLCTNGFFLLVRHNKLGMVHYINRGFTCNTFQTKISLKIVFVLTNRVDPDEMPLGAAFHQGLHCLPKCAIRSHWYTKGYYTNAKIS